MDNSAQAAPASKSRAYLNKLKHPSQFSKPQLAVFILVFGIIGYFVFKSFAAGTVVATLQGENMSAQLAVTAGANSKLSQSGPAHVSVVSNINFSNITKPSVSGSLTVGSTLTAANGTWSPTPTSYSYAWQICDSSGNNCYRSSGSVATSNTYKILSSDVGHTVRVQVAPNGEFNRSVDSAPTALVSSAGIANTSLPTISGNTVVGSVLTASNGTWSPTPTSYSYAWQICDTTGSNCTRSSTSVVTSNTYTLQAGDAGHTVRVQVAPNGNFNYAVDSAPTAVVSSPATGGFTNTALPALSGSAKVGSTLSVTSGSWTPTPSSYSYAWHLCNPNTGSCSLSPTTANQNTYVIQAGDVGSEVVAQVAPNGQWASAKDSNLSAVVTATSINFSVVSDSTASGGKAVKFGGGVQIVGTVSLPAAASSFTVNARSDGCGSSFPYMSVSVDGNSYMSRTAVNPSTSWNGYSASVNLGSGNHTLVITDLDSTSSPCNLYIDDTNFYGQTTPAPTVSLSASPSTITSGQSSTLAWSSTNATSCTASGAWSGSQAASGSTSVSPTSNSTYSLSCTGAGGNSSASTTVTVTSGSTGGAVSFDGSATKMTTLYSYETTYDDPNTRVSAQSPVLWDCLCFINNDISLAPDSTFGQVYDVNVRYQDNNGWPGSVTSTSSAAQVSKRRNNDLGKTDYFAMAVKVPSWNGPVGDLFFSDIASLGYQTSSNDQFAFGVSRGPNDQLPFTYDVAVNAGLSSDGPQGNSPGTTNFKDLLMPVTFGQWRDWVFAITYSTNKTGEIKIYSRLPGGTWSVVYDKANIDTYLYGSVQGAGTFAQDGSNWPTVIDKIGLYYGVYGGESQHVQESGLTISTSLSAAESTLK